MPVESRARLERPNHWTCLGHSYCNYAAGTFDQTGRVDGQFRSMLDVELNHWRNFAVNGARITYEGAAQGGWATLYREVNKQAGRTAPYSPEGGALLICIGINDIGNVGNTTQVRGAFKDALRACISRWRASTIKENTDASVAYGAGFTLSTGHIDNASGGSWHQATSTTSATVTITIPADYVGETIAVSWIGRPGANAGVVTYSGTAGLTGTRNLSDVMPAATFSQLACITRYVAPVTGATQTIIATVTSLDAGGQIYFDGWWLEAKAAPPVVVCDIPKLTAAGYTNSYASWTGTEAQKDADVDNFNADIASVAAEFDSMVQVAKMDAKLAKNAAYFFDGLHPNESGAALCVDAIVDAVNRFTPVTTLGKTASLGSPAPMAAPSRIRRRSGDWVTAEYTAIGSNYTAVSGDMFALPLEVTEARDRYDRLSLETAASVAGTSVRWGVFADLTNSGYPDTLVTEVTSGGAFTVPTATGAQLNPASGAGSLFFICDPGLYWLAIKFGPVGTTHTFKTLAGPNPHIPSLTTGGAVTGAGWIGYKLTGQGTGAFATTFPTGGVLTNNVPLIGIHKT